jgi:hypothetical protein
VLIEKTPINTFRLSFIDRIFPDARFIHIYRNGLEVARSIEKLSETGQWFGHDSYKWNKLVEYASSRDDAAAVLELCSNYFDWGLLEWRLSTEAAVEFLRHLPQSSFLEFSYDEFTQMPIDTLSRALLFIGIDDDNNVKRFASDNILRRTTPVRIEAVSEKQRAIGGKLLPLSMDGPSGLTRRCT